MISTERLRKYLSHSQLVRLRKGHVLFSRGQRDPKVLFLLETGRVKLSLLTEDGHERVITYAERGAVLGESSVLTDAGYLVTAEAVADCRVYLFGREVIARAVREDPGLAVELIEVLVDKLRLTVRLIEEQSFLGAKERVAQAIARLATGEDPLAAVPGGAAGCPAQLRLTQQELAGLAGTSRVTVANALAEFSRRGAIRQGRRRLIVRDLNLLMRAGK